jgi:low affinity Fe/Cu permease
MREMFHRFAQRASNIMGSPWAFAVAVITIIVWAITGPMFAFSDSWQLIINTSTTIVTFLMVFLIQNTQNREAKSTQLKLDELIRALPQARTALVDLEDFSEAELDELQQEFQRILKRIKGSRNRPG